MIASQNEIGKNCPQCNASFACSIENCWCSTLPHIMEMSSNRDCFCPECLNAMISNKTEKEKDKKKLSFIKKEEMIEHLDYYINEEGYWVFTTAYHLKRGYCCENGCKHCPYGFIKVNL